MHTAPSAGPQLPSTLGLGECGVGAEGSLIGLFLSHGGKAEVVATQAMPRVCNLSSPFARGNT